MNLEPLTLMRDLLTLQPGVNLWGALQYSLYNEQGLEAACKNGTSASDFPACAMALVYGFKDTARPLRVSGHNI